MIQETTENYLQETSLSHRQQYGQFFTPWKVACLMASWIAERYPHKILDPAFGMGVFYEAYLYEKNSYDKFLFTGYEIDNQILNYVRVSKKKHLELHHEDFLMANVPTFNAIICNPPYMRFNKYPNRHKVLEKLQKEIGKPIAGHTNIASLFLIKSLYKLRPKGKLAFIMPYEFFNTEYGKQVKSLLMERKLLKHVIIFSNEKRIFPDVTTTVCILLCDYDQKLSPVKVHFVEDEEDLPGYAGYLDDLDCILVKPEKLDPNKKWTPIFESCRYKEINTPRYFKPLSHYGKVTRGLATGANKFFALTQEEVEILGLPQENLTPCITSSYQVNKPIFNDEDWLHLKNRRYIPIYCLDVKNEQDENTRNYLRYGEQQKYHLRYLTKNRKPWYKIEKRKPAPIWFGVFYRQGHKVVRNFSSTLTFSCFHGFYPYENKKRFVDKIFIYLLSRLGERMAQQQRRIYGNKLYKYEPGDLSAVLCPSESQFDLWSEKEIEETIGMFYLNRKKFFEQVNALAERIIEKTE